MKKFLLLSHYAPKPGFKYPEHDCPLAHRASAHKRIYALERFWPEGVLWHTLEVENTSRAKLLAAVKDPSLDAVWLSGSPYLLKEASNFPWIANAVAAAQILMEEDKNPVIGLCFGLQLLSKAVGGTVAATDYYRIGETDIIKPTGERMVRTKVYHENYVETLPDPAQVLGFTTTGYPYLVKFSNKVLGVQSHPECALKDELENQRAENFWRKTLVNLVQ